MSNDDNDGGPVEPTPLDAAAELDLKRRMKVILPQLREFFVRLDEEIDAAKAEGRSVNHAGLAVQYRFWRDAADAAIMIHWNKFEQGLTQAQRDEQLPHAAEDFAEEIRRPSEYEAWKEHVTERQPAKTVRENEELFTEFEKVARAAKDISTENTTSFAARAIRKSGGDLPPH